MTGASQFERLDEVICAWAQRTPTACAAILGSKEFSYEWFGTHVRALAGALSGSGVRKGDRIAVLQNPHPEFLLTLFAASSLGAIWVGLNPRYQKAELLHVLRDSQPRVLITRSLLQDRNYAQDIAEFRSAIPTLEHILVFDSDPALPGTQHMRDFMLAHRSTDEAVRRARSGLSASDPCILVYTSGSTGAPKGALLSHSGILTVARCQNEVWPIFPARTLNYFPINHVGSVVDNAVPCLAAGGTVVFMEAFDAARSIQLIDEHALTTVGSVPSAFFLQMACPEYAQARWSTVRLLIWEGAAMTAEGVQVLLQRGCPLATNYGMTEANGITILEPTRDVDLLTNSVGGVYPGASIRLLSAEGVEVTGDTAGEVWVKSGTNFVGYWQNPEATAAAVSPDGYFRTGDLAVRRPDGRYRLVGRVKEMFKSGGYNVYPREVEAAIEEHPAILTAVVVARPDPLWQEVGVAFVIPKPGMTADGLEEWLKQRVANYKRPKRFVVRSELPLLPIGKVDRAALKRIAAGID